MTLRRAAHPTANVVQPVDAHGRSYHGLLVSISDMLRKKAEMERAHQKERAQLCSTFEKQLAKANEDFIRQAPSLYNAALTLANDQSAAFEEQQVGHERCRSR